MDKDRALLAQYRAHQQFYVERLVSAAEKLGALNERLSDGS